MEFGGRTDMGRVRENNEDSFRVAPDINLFVLSDGMGGQASGEVASSLATEAVIAHCREAEANPSLPLAWKPIEGVSRVSNRLASAIQLANRAVYESAQKEERCRGMGATIVAVRFFDERMSVAHVGDSRAYRLRGGQLEQLTQDHSFVAEQVRQGMLTEQEAGTSTLQSVLLRAVGIEPEVEVAVEEELMMEGDTVLLCSDGLTRELSDVQIAAILEDAGDTQEAADRLVDAANRAGGSDNVTVVVLRKSATPVGAFARIGFFRRWFKNGG